MSADAKEMKENILWKRIIAARLEADEMCRPRPMVIGTQYGIYSNAACQEASEKVVALLRKYQNMLGANSNESRSQN